MSCLRKSISKPPMLYWSPLVEEVSRNQEQLHHGLFKSRQCLMGQNRHKHLILPKGRSLCWCGHTAPLGVPCTSGWHCWTPGRGCRSARPAWCPPDSRTGVPGDRKLPHSPFHLLFQQPAEGIVQFYFMSMLLPGLRALEAGGSRLLYLLNVALKAVNTD